MSKDNKDEIFNALMSMANTYSKALASLNSRTLKFLESDAASNLVNAYSNVMKGLYSIDTLKVSAQTVMKSLSYAYDNLLDSYNGAFEITDALKKSLSNLQIGTMVLLSQAYQSTMIMDLTKCFASADYVAIIKVLNETLKKPSVPASDVAFMKMSDLTDILNDEIKYPKGFENSIKELNKSTAADISNKADLVYDTARNHFISDDGNTNSTGLNVICSGKAIISSISGDLFNENELINFMTFLSLYPTLAMTDDTGKKIYQWLNELHNRGTYTIDFDKDDYFHCRSHKKGDAPFTYDQMLKAPNGLPWAGRFNQVGRSNYYFADTRKGAESEVKKHLTKDDVLQTVELKPIRKIDLLDLSGTLARGATFLRYIRFSLSDINDKMPREYLIPCFVSDCCKRIGFDGIKYYGTKEYSNYVAWNDGYFSFVTMCD